MSTHMGRKPRDHVTLAAVLSDNTQDMTKDIDFIRIFPNARADQAPQWFRIPQNRFLVITDVDWRCDSGIPGSTQTLSIFIQNIQNQSRRHKVFESTIQLNAEGRGGISYSMMSGFVVSFQARINVNLFPVGANIASLILRGYLVPV
jgi:hypothetical protein